MNAKVSDIWDMIDKLSPKDRRVIYKRMNEDIRFRMLDIIDTVNERTEEEVDLSEITEEVEAVRGSRHVED